MEPEELYTDLIVDLNRHPRNYGTINEADVCLKGGNPVCGDMVTFDVKFDGDKILDIKFSGSGCSISRAAQSLLTEMVIGKTVDHALSLTPEDVLEELGNIVQLRMKCALLGLHVLQEGIRRARTTGERSISGIRI